MRHILALSNRELLEEIAWSHVLLAFDFDGTLAPIVAERENAAMRQRTGALLRALAALYPCVVISGRSRADVLRRLGGAAVRGVVGNHGLEPGGAGGRAAAAVQRWRVRLATDLDGLRGVEIEDKTYSLAVHYRRSRQKKRARAAILAAVEALDGARLIGGRQVVNVLPLGAPHKGIALERELRRLGCDTALYVGDDETDEDVFGLDRPGQLTTVRVGRDPDSAAAYYLKNQDEIDALLALLVTLRRDRARRWRQA